MYCDHCGYRLDRAEKFCPVCGNVVRNEYRMAKAYRVNTAEYTQPREEEFPFFRSIVSVLIALILVAAVLISGIFEPSHKQSGSSGAATGSTAVVAEATEEAATEEATGGAAAETTPEEATGESAAEAAAEEAAGEVTEETAAEEAAGEINEEMLGPIEETETASAEEESAEEKSAEANQQAEAEESREAGLSAEEVPAAEEEAPAPANGGQEIVLEETSDTSLDGQVEIVLVGWDQDESTITLRIYNNADQEIRTFGFPLLTIDGRCTELDPFSNMSLNLVEIAADSYVDIEYHVDPAIFEEGGRIDGELHIMDPSISDRSYSLDVNII